MSLQAGRGNLPHAQTSLVGRSGAVSEVASLVRSRPLVTLTGVGGVGKSRLALEAAHRSAETSELVGLP